MSTTTSTTLSSKEKKIKKRPQKPQQQQKAFHTNKEKTAMSSVSDTLFPPTKECESTTTTTATATSSSLFQVKTIPQVAAKLAKKIDLPARTMTRRDKVRLTHIAAQQEEEVDGDDGNAITYEEKASQQQQKQKGDPKTTVYVGNLPITTTKNSLRKMFRPCGDIHSVRLRTHQKNPFHRSTNCRDATVILRKNQKQQQQQRDMDGGEDAAAPTSSLFGYVCFQSIDSVAKALEMDGTVHFDEASAENYTLRVDRGDGTSSVFSPTCSVFVGNISRTASERELAQFFKQHGIASVLHVRLVRDAETGRGRGFGFVSFTNAKDVPIVLKNMNGVEFDGRPMRITPVDNHATAAVMKNKRQPKRSRDQSGEGGYNNTKNHTHSSSSSSSTSSFAPNWQGTVAQPARTVNELPKRMRKLLKVVIPLTAEQKGAATTTDTKRNGVATTKKKTYGSNSATAKKQSSKKGK